MSVKANKSQAQYVQKATDNLWGNKYLWTAILCILSAVLALIKPLVLGDGGSITCLSLLFIWLVSYFYGFKWGFISGFLIGFVRLVVVYATGEYVNFAPGAILLEYPIACASMAFGALLVRNKQGVNQPNDTERNFKGLKRGYIVSVICMGLCYVVSAQLFYEPSYTDQLTNLLFNIVYDFSYLTVEAAITFVLLCIPVVEEAINFSKYVAITKKEDPTLLSF